MKLIFKKKKKKNPGQVVIVILFLTLHYQLSSRTRYNTRSLICSFSNKPPPATTTTTPCKERAANDFGNASFDNFTEDFFGEKYK